jgi:hypothetical protein
VMYEPDGEPCEDVDSICGVQAFFYCLDPTGEPVKIYDGKAVTQLKRGQHFNRIMNTSALRRTRTKLTWDVVHASA